MKTVNNVRKNREERLMSKMELARLAGMSAATIDRIERGEACRMETRRKIILPWDSLWRTRRRFSPSDYRS